MKKIDTAISKIINITHQIYSYRFKECRDNEIELTVREAEYICQKCEKAQLLLRTSNTLLQENKKSSREISSNSCADWIE